MRPDFVRPLPALAAVLMMIGCEPAERNVEPDPATQAATAVESTTVTDSTSVVEAPDDRGVVLFLGTSLTAGLGLDPGESYPAMIQEKIDSAGLPFRVVNAGISGETSAGARGRVDWLLRQDFDVLVLETGANDMLRGSAVDATRRNIQAIIDRVRAERPDASIVLAEMHAAPTLGREYV